MIPQIGPTALAERLRQPNPPQLIDVREPWEFAIAHLPDAKLHALNQISDWSRELAKDGKYVLVCHHGGRSQMACQLLRQIGFSDVTNLDGGTDAWAIEVDNSMARY